MLQYLGSLMSDTRLILNSFGETFLHGTDLALDGEGKGVEVVQRSFGGEPSDMEGSKI